MHVPSNVAVMSPHSSSKKSGQPVKTEEVVKSAPSSVSDVSQQDTESTRGRPQDRENSDDGRSDNGSGEDKDDHPVKAGNGQHRKRKRSRKGLDKKYPCPHVGCGKSYSRAEHLYRHQLNREESQTFGTFDLRLTLCRRYSQGDIPL